MKLLIDKIIIDKKIGKINREIKILCSFLLIY